MTKTLEILTNECITTLNKRIDIKNPPYKICTLFYTEDDQQPICKYIGKKIYISGLQWYSCYNGRIK